MITAREQLPLLRLNRREVVHYEESWILDLIQQAALRAGVEKPLFVEDIARGIVIYLKERFLDNSIAIEDFFRKIERTLCAIGFEEVAGKLEVTSPPSRLSLVQVAEEAGDAYELAFFQTLTEKLRKAKAQGVTEVHCSELKDAVSRLCGSKQWNAKCEALRGEILGFLANEVGRDAEADQVTILVR
ncbi:MAG: hypothetical protein AAF191_10605 [Verrucomicrobiota bacterium]